MEHQVSSIVTVKVTGDCYVSEVEHALFWLYHWMKDVRRL